MDIMDIINQKVIASKCSITVKDKNNKTKGVVRNLIRFKDLQCNKQIDYFKLFRSIGIWGNNKINIDNCYILDNNIYLLRNMKSYKYYTPEEQTEYDNIYQNIAQNGINVINVIL